MLCKSNWENVFCSKEERSGIVGEARYQGMSPPSHYNAINLNVIKSKAPSARLKTETIRFKPDKRTDMSPTLYKPSEKLTKPKNPNYSLEKSPLRNFISRHTNAKNFVPSPVQYNPDKADKIITLGARRGYK